MPKLISQKNFSNQVSSNIVTNSTIEVSLHEFSKTSFRSGKYQIQISRGNLYQTTEFLIVHDGTTTFNTEYGTIKNGPTLASLSSEVSGNNIKVLVTPNFSDTTQIKLVGMLIHT